MGVARRLLQVTVTKALVSYKFPTHLQEGATQQQPAPPPPSRPPATPQAGLRFWTVRTEACVSLLMARASKLPRTLTSAHPVTPRVPGWALEDIVWDPVALVRDWLRTFGAHTS